MDTRFYIRTQQTSPVARVVFMLQLARTGNHMRACDVAPGQLQLALTIMTFRTDARWQQDVCLVAWF